MSAIPEIDSGKCNGCGDCVIQCPTKSVELVGGKVAIVRPQDCNYCTECEALCSSGAIRCSFGIILVDETESKS